MSSENIRIHVWEEHEDGRNTSRRLQGLWNVSMDATYEIKDETIMMSDITVELTGNLVEEPGKHAPLKCDELIVQYLTKKDGEDKVIADTVLANMTSARMHMQTNVAGTIITYTIKFKRGYVGYTTSAPDGWVDWKQQEEESGLQASSIVG